MVLQPRLQAAIDKLNPDIPVSAKKQALGEVLNLTGQSLIESNQAFHQMLTDGVRVEYQENANTVGGTVWLIDLVKHFSVFERIANNDPKTGLSRVETVKKMVAYHQYHAVNKAVESTVFRKTMPILCPVNI